MSTASDEDDRTETLPAARSAEPEDEEPEVTSSASNFDRHTFPRDSGCFASSSPASDRSSQQSQSESGIHLDDEEPDADHHEHDLGDKKSVIAPKAATKRLPEQSAKARSLRDQHRIAQSDLERLSLNSPGDHDNAEDKTFDQLVEKYVKSDEKSLMQSGLVNNTRKVFEK